MVNGASSAVGSAPVTGRRPRRLLPVLLETVAVLASPIVAFFVLRVRAMAPVQLPDPSMHTVYIVDPSQMFTRYAAAFAPTARMREGAQAGFLVLARLIYLGFGALPGFFVTRYVFALIAVVPAYLLLRRLYGIPAGVVAVVLILSSPVVLTAWGTDYPDSAVVSYVCGAVACLAMPSRARWRPAWLVLATGLLTLAAWSHGTGVVLAVTTLAVYALVRLWRDRGHLFREGLLAVGVIVAVTFALMVASRLVLGQFDFIRPTLSGEAFLDKPAQLRQWHSANWRWAPYVAYLLVPPSVIVAFLVSFSRRLRNIATPQLFVGLACAGQFGVFYYLQFDYHVQDLEMHFFSSTLWGTVCLALAIVLAELSGCVAANRVTRWLPALLLVAVPLAYEADPHVPAFGWWPTGAALAAVPVLFAGIMRFSAHIDPTSVARKVGLGLAVTVSVVAMAGSLLVLTVAPRPKLPRLGGLASAGDPSPSYAGALGGQSATLLDWYQVSAELLYFVGDPSYKGEQLMMWFPWNQPLLEPVGIFHEGFDALGPGFPALTTSNMHKLDHRRPAELLFMSLTGADFRRALNALGPYLPVLVRTGVLRDGTAVLHVWLVVLRSFASPAVWPTITS